MNDEMPLWLAQVDETWLVRVTPVNSRQAELVIIRMADNEEISNQVIELTTSIAFMPDREDVYEWVTIATETIDRYKRGALA